MIPYAQHEYVKVLANTEKGVCLEYVPSGRTVTLSPSFFNQLSTEGALKIIGIS